jgi:branched-chain amino acid transport system ATP-binding protein
MLELQGVSTFYGHVQALRGVSMQVYEGEIVALIGANGAGKTTLLNTISGITPARAGQILLDGRPIEHLSPSRLVRLGISHVPERRQVFGPLTVEDNLLLGAYHRYRADGRRKVMSDIEQVFDTFPVLGERHRQPAGTLSGGEQQMLAVGRGLMSRPRLLMLDEPSLGLAPMLVREIFRVIRSLREQGTTVLLVEQNARAALRVADRGYVLERGAIVAEGSAEELLHDERVQRAYLGRRNGRERRERISEPANRRMSE